MTQPDVGAGSDARGTPGEIWTVLRMIRWSAEYLAGKGIDRKQARLDAEHLLAHAVGTERLQLYLAFDRPLTRPELDAFRPLLKRRAAREPLQYVLGRAAFRELDLRVDRRVLIPRPETEQLVEAVLGWAFERVGYERPKGRPPAGREPLPWSGDETSDEREGRDPPERTAGMPRTLSALDVGTGSGCIALSLALEGPFERVVATDRSEDALEVAALNAREADVGGTVDLRPGDLYGPVEGERFDVVVANPPYVRPSEADDLEPEVRDFEPASALFGGEDGLAWLKRLVAGAEDVLEAGGLLALEVGVDQAESVAGLVRDSGAFEGVTVRRDLSGRPRMVLATRTPPFTRPSNGATLRHKE